MGRRHLQPHLCLTLTLNKFHADFALNAETSRSLVILRAAPDATAQNIDDLTNLTLRNAGGTPWRKRDRCPNTLKDWPLQNIVRTDMLRKCCMTHTAMGLLLQQWRLRLHRQHLVLRQHLRLLLGRQHNLTYHIDMTNLNNNTKRTILPWDHLSALKRA